MTPLRILIIDNNAEDRLMMNRALADFIVNEAATANKGIEAAQQTNPDCILLAYGLPEIDGFAILEHLIPEPTSPKVAVVMLMGADDATIANVAIKRGAQDCLTKSCLEPRDFRRVIHSAVARVELNFQRHGAEQELAASEARYRSIVEDQTEMVNRFHADGTLTFVNAPFARAFGRMPPQLIGTSLYKLIPDVERAFIRNAIAGLTPRNPVVTHRHRAFVADGSIRWQEWSNRLLPRQEGKLDEYQGTGRDITERKRAEDALQESQECIAAILTTAMDAVVAVDERQCIILFNRAAADLFHCPSEEAIGKPLDRFIPEPFRHGHAEDIRRFGETGGTVRSMGNLRALRALRADGTEIPIEASISTTKAGGRTIYTVILRDITARQTAEDALRESEARFRGTFENAAVGMARVGLDGSWLEVNGRLCEITGYTREELLATTFQEITHEGDLAADLDNARKVLAGEIPHYAMDKRYIRKDGRIVWIGLTVALQRDASGEPLYFISVVRDITARKKAEDALRASEERFRTITTTAQEGIWVLDSESKTLFVNPRMAELLGAHPEEMIGKSVTEFCFPEDADKARARIAANLSGQRTEFEFRFRCPDGTPLDVLAATAPLNGPDGKVIGALGGFLDLADRKAAEEHQRFLMRELSHRSNNLLTIIQSIASQTARSAASLSDFQDRFSRRLLGIAASHDVLIRQNWEGAPLADLIRQHVDPFDGAAESRLLLDGPNVSVSPSAAQALGLALHELATNSVKYGALSRPQGQVAVTWSYEHNGNERLLLRLHWRERGGPPVSPPTHKGFGHAVIESMVAHSLNGDVILDFAPDGLNWSLSMPTTHLANKGSVEAAHHS